MEDELSICISSKSNGTSFMGIFDGHGGKEAAIYAREHLYSNIQSQPEFAQSDPEKVKCAIREGFLQTHLEMTRVVDTWPKRKDGFHSTSGTTATIVILRDGKLYVAHVGDSAAVLSCKKDKEFEAKELTRDHKPEDVNEKARIESLGGKVVVSNTGVHRVVWKRLSRNIISSPGRFEWVPFLAVSRALGDLWSYDDEIDEFIVSPEPDINVIDYDPIVHKFLIVASDGLWGVMDAHAAVRIVSKYEQGSTLQPDRRNCSRHLLNESLEMWQKRRSRADNISVIVAFFDDEFGANVDSERIDVSDVEERVSDADTDVVDTDECPDETPQESNDTCDVKMCRQIAFRDESNPIKLPPVSPPHETIQTNDVNEVCSLGKRKNDDTTCSSHQKKVKTSSMQQDGHVCNVVTDISSESLCDLQLDDELGFADDESDEISTVMDTSRGEKLSKEVS